MLSNRLMDSKTYEDRIIEAMTQIPLYSSEWTNYNASDPGMTVLENLSLFETLQQEHIEEMPSEVKLALLKMAGFTPIKGRTSRVLLKIDGAKHPFDIPMGQSFTLGNLNFETGRRISYPNCHILAIYSVEKDTVKDISFIQDEEITLSAKPFGNEPDADNAFYIVCDKLPEANEEMYFYANCNEPYERNPFEDKNSDLFAALSWEIYTEKGFVKLNSQDYTGGFLCSGEIRMRMPEEAPIIFDKLPEEGYVIRARIESASYDMVPEITSFYGFLIEAWQRTTKSFVVSSKTGNIKMRKDLADSRYLTIFVREEKGGSFYKYTLAPDANALGRYFDIKEESGEYIYKFDKSRHGYGPDKSRGSIKILAYDESVMRSFNLGEVIGYDNQVISLPFKKIELENFSLIIRRNIDGLETYDFAKPNRNASGELEYSLKPETGEVIINQAGDYIGAKLFIGACAVMEGDNGNIRAGNKFTAHGLPSYITVTNPAVGGGGRFRENLNQLRKRFLEDIDRPFAAVTETDYERLVMETPGLCIRKVRAIMDAGLNQVRVAVMPGIGGDRAPLMPDYKKIIEDRLESRRLLCTRIHVIPPVYVPVNLHATVYIHHHFDNYEDDIREVIKECLDYTKDNRQFGETLSYEKIFHRIESLPYVAYIYDLKMVCHKLGQGTMKGKDIVPIDNGLIVPNDIKLEFMTYYD